MTGVARVSVTVLVPTDTLDGVRAVVAVPPFMVYALAGGTELVSRSSEWVRTSDVPSTVALSGAGARFALTLTSWPTIQAKSAGRDSKYGCLTPDLLPASAVNSVPPRLNTVPSGT